jgi:hypothetical protein
LLVGLLLLPATAPSTEACESTAGPNGGARIEGREHVVVFRTRPPRVAVGEFFSVEAMVCLRGSRLAPTALRVDAVMPEHRHGMNYRATVSAQGQGRYVAEGLLFHMPGRWQLLFDVATGSRTERLVSDLVLE